MLSLLYRWASPPHFYRWASLCLPWLGILGISLLISGMLSGLILAPADYLQGDAFRIMYVHVPCAFLSLGIYTGMALLACISLIWRIKLADVLIAACIPYGAWLTFLALITGALWGKPMWGTWWIWDARLTSELILWFLYLGLLGLRSAIMDQADAAKAIAILVLVGVINIPIIHYSVYWWNTLHQATSLSLWGHSSIAPSMLYPLLLSIAGFACYTAMLILARARCEILTREGDSHWVKQL